MEGNFKNFVTNPHPSIIWRVFCILIIIISLVRCVYQSSNFVDYSNQAFEGQISSTIKKQGRVRQFYVSDEQANKIKIITNLSTELSYGDSLLIKCQSYQTLNKFGLTGECAWPQIKNLDQIKFNINIFFQTIRYQANGYLEQYLVEPYLSLTTGLLWGDDTNLTSQLKKDFQKTGTSHILAASGYNLMVLSSLLFYLFVSFGLYRKQATLVVLMGVIFFVFLAGLEPSVMRAGLMISVVILSRLLGQKADQVNLLLGTAALMLVVKPSLIINIGWQLSFMAMVGLMSILPKLEIIFSSISDWHGLKEIFLQTLAANLATWPVIVWQFERLSVISPVANIIVSPIVNISFIISSPIFILFGLEPIKQLLAWIWQTCLMWLIMAVSFLASLSGSEIFMSQSASLIVSPVYVWLIWKIITYEKKI